MERIINICINENGEIIEPTSIGKYTVDQITIRKGEVIEHKGLIFDWTGKDIINYNYGTKICKYRNCDKVIKGRSDKKFCNRICKGKEYTYRKRSKIKNNK